MSPRAWTGDSPAPSWRCEGAIAHRALVRYDAYNELSGQQSMSIALLDDERSGIVLSCIHHRDQARVYAKQVHGGQGGSWSSRPRRPRPCAWRSPRPPAASVSECLSENPSARVPMTADGGIPGSPDALQGRLPRSGGNLQRGGAAVQRRPGFGRACPAGDDLRHGHGASRRGGRVGDRPDRELARRLGQRHARSARRRGRGLQIVGETLLTVRHSLIAAQLVGVGGDRHGPLPSTGPRAVRTVPARRAPTRTGPAGQLDRGGGQRGRRGSAAPGWAALGTRLAAEIYGGTVVREGVQDRDDNETRFVWLGRRGEEPPRRHRCGIVRRPSTAGRPRWCSGAPGRIVPAGWCAAWTSSLAARST